jgi:hypothetical protein
MSFGRPPSINIGFKPSPPDRGSFPLDHEGRLISFPVITLSDRPARRMQGPDEVVYGLSSQELEYF